MKAYKPMSLLREVSEYTQSWRVFPECRSLLLWQHRTEHERLYTNVPIKGSVGAHKELEGVPWVQEPSYMTAQDGTWRLINLWRKCRSTYRVGGCSLNAGASFSDITGRSINAYKPALIEGSVGARSELEGVPLVQEPPSRISQDGTWMLINQYLLKEA